MSGEKWPWYGKLVYALVIVLMVAGITGTTVVVYATARACHRATMAVDAKAEMAQAANKVEKTCGVAVAGAWGDFFFLLPELGAEEVESNLPVVEAGKTCLDNHEALIVAVRRYVSVRR